MAFLPYDPTRKLDDWHQQWGGTPQASGPGGGDVPFTAGAQPPAMPDWSQYRGQTQWDQAMPPSGGFTPLSQVARGGGGVGAARLPPMMTPPGGPATATGPGGGPGELVLLRAPNGQTKQVPGDQVAHYLARGATRG